MKIRMIVLVALIISAAVCLPTVWAQAPLEENLIKSSTSSDIFLVKNQQLCHITSMNIFYGMGWSESSINVYSQQVINLYGNGLDVIGEGSLFKISTSGTTVYKVSGSTKYPFQNWNAFIQAGYHGEQIVAVTQTVANMFPNTGATIQPANPNAPTDGSLVKEIGNSNVYWFKSMKKYWFINQTFFDAMGFSFGNVVEYPAGTLNQYSSGPDFVSNGSLIKGESTVVYRIENGQKRPFANWDAFIQEGHHKEEVLTVTPAILDMFGDGAMINFTPPDQTEPNAFMINGPGTVSNLPVTFTIGGSDNVSPQSFLAFSWKMDNGNWSNWLNQTSITVYDNLNQGQHCFYVRALDEFGNEETSPAQWQFQFQPTIPAPSNLTAQATSYSEISLNWQDNSSNEIANRVYRGDSPSGNFEWIGETNANITHYIDSGLQGNHTYYYYVAAYNGSNQSPYSNQAFAQTPNPPFQLTAPSNLAATAVSQTQINQNWQDNSNNESGFRVYRSNQPQSGFTLLATVSTNVTAYSNTGLSQNQTWYYRVTAYNSQGESGNSNTVSATTPSQPPPPPPPDQNYAYGFDYLVGNTNSFGPPWVDSQRFGSIWKYATPHWGHDINKNGEDYGEPIYAIANGVIVFATLGTNVDEWGMVMIIKFTAPAGCHFILPDGREVTQAYLQIAHMSEIKIHRQNGETVNFSQIVAGETKVYLGEQIAKIGDAYDQWPSHLHAEGRDFYTSSYPQGYGYGTNLQGRFDLLEFIALNRTIPQTDQNYSFVVHCYDSYDPGYASFEKSGSGWTQQRNYTWSDIDLGYNNNFYSHSASTDGLAKWHFSIPAAGNYLVQAYIPRDFATATRAVYKIHCGNQVSDSPQINQNGYSNEWVNLGTFSFSQGNGNYVELNANTGEAGVLIAADAIRASYSTGGAGGGGTWSIGNPIEWLITSPNPFNEAISISYQLLGEGGETELVVYDLLGRQLVTINSQWQNAGTYQYIWDPEQLPTGMYLCRLTHGSAIAVEKILYLK